MQNNFRVKLILVSGIFNLLSGFDLSATQLCGKAYTERAQLGEKIVYPERFIVPEDKRPWKIPYPDYAPPYYIDDHVKANVYHAEANPKGWAESENFTQNFTILKQGNEINPNQSKIMSTAQKVFSTVKSQVGKILPKSQGQSLIKSVCPSLCTSHQREWDNKFNPPQNDGQYFCGCILKSKFNSHLGELQKNDKNLPLNPCGRTGIAGRGLLGKWGPNQAADPVITRYNPASGDLEVLLIKRGDGGQWAIPGGMVDTTDPNISAAAARELQEETGSKVTMGDAKEIYKGIVRDPRNTDNSWMETVVLHKHLSNELSLKAADNLQAHDAQEIKKIQWVKFDDPRMSNLYASHTDFVHKALESMEKHIAPFAH